MTVRASPALLCAALALSGCGDDPGGAPLLSGAAASVTLSTSAAGPMAATGETRSVTAVVRDAAGEELPSPEVSWSTGAPEVATVSGSGATAVLTAVDDGVAVVTATSGAARGTLAVTVHRALASVEVSAPSRVLAFGASVQLVATARDPLGHALDGAAGFTFASGDPDRVAVSDGGVATAIFALDAPRVTTVTATLTRDGLTASGAVEIATGPPDVFDHAALLLSEYELPAPIPTLGQGIAYFAVDGARVGYTLAWSRLSGPAIRASLRGPATAAELADVLVELPPGDQTSGHGSTTGSFGAADLRAGCSLDAVLALMARGDAYVEVSTAELSAGEIRGQVLEVAR